MRLRVPDEGETVVHDLIRGDTTFQHVHMDDPVIARADGSVLYNFAVAVDDLDSEITHVDPRRGPPLQHAQAAARARGDGRRSRRSTRTCRCCTVPTARSSPSATAPLRCRSCATAGYLPEAVRNYIALLGWGDADDETLISTDELVKRFRIERVSRNPAQFDEQKLRWMNGRYMRELGTDEITRRLEELTGRSGLHDAVAISEEKIQTLADFWPLAGFIFDGPADDPSAREKWLSDGGREALVDARAALEGADPFDSEHIEQALRGVVETRGVKAKDVFQPVRVALAGTTVSPGIFETLEVLGRDESLSRIDAALRT